MLFAWSLAICLSPAQVFAWRSLHPPRLVSPSLSSSCMRGQCGACQNTVKQCPGNAILAMLGEGLPPKESFKIWPYPSQILATVMLQLEVLTSCCTEAEESSAQASSSVTFPEFAPMPPPHTSAFRGSPPGHLHPFHLAPPRACPHTTSHAPGRACPRLQRAARARSMQNSLGFLN